MGRDQVPDPAFQEEPRIALVRYAISKLPNYGPLAYFVGDFRHIDPLVWDKIPRFYISEWTR